MMDNQHLLRLTVPYMDIFTTVYLLQSEKGALLFDTASYDADVETYILPFLKEAGVTADALKYIFISHTHTDHAGGLASLLKHFPEVTVLSRSPVLKEKFGSVVYAPEEGELILDAYRVVTIPGHTQDSAGLLDLRSRTLVSGDCLQLYGIFGSGKWGANIRWPREYFEALKRVEALAPSRICTAHDYAPTGYQAVGGEEVQMLLENCRVPLLRLKELLLENQERSDEEIAALYGNGPVFPRISSGVVAAMRAFL